MCGDVHPIVGGVVAEPVRVRRLTDREGQKLQQRPIKLGQPFTRWAIRKLAAYLRKVHGRVICVGREALRCLVGRRGITFQRTKTWKESPDAVRDAKLDRIENVLDCFPDRSSRSTSSDRGIRPTAGSSWAPASHPERHPDLAWIAADQLVVRCLLHDRLEEAVGLGDGRGSDKRGLDRRRTRAVVLADLGGVRLRQGDVDGALAAWHDFLDCADGIRSVKAQAALQAMRVRLRRYTKVPETQELREQSARISD